jgi:hypothetical protein
MREDVFREAQESLGVCLSILHVIQLRACGQPLDP